MKILVNTRPYILREYKIPRFNSAFPIESDNFMVKTDNETIKAVSTYQVLNEPFSLLLPLGGVNGDIYKNFLNSYKLFPTIIELKDETSEIISIDDEIRRLRVKTKLPRLTNEEREEIYYSFTQSLYFASCIQILNNYYDKESNNIHKNLIRIARKNNVKIALYLTKENIKEMLFLRPNIVLIDKKTLEEFRDLEIRSDFEISRSCGDIIKMGIDAVLYLKDNCELNLYTAKRNYRTRSENLKEININSILAGFICAYSKNYSYGECLKFAKASGHINTKISGLNVDAGQVKKNLHMIEVEGFNVSV